MHHRRATIVFAAMLVCDSGIMAAMSACNGKEGDTEPTAADVTAAEEDAVAADSTLDGAMESTHPADACDFLDADNGPPPHCFEKNDALMSACSLEDPCPAPLVCWWDPGCASPRGHCSWPPSCSGDCGFDGCDKPHYCSCCGNVPLVLPIAPNVVCEAGAL